MNPELCLSSLKELKHLLKRVKRNDNSLNYLSTNQDFIFLSQKLYLEVSNLVNHIYSLTMVIDLSYNFTNLYNRVNDINELLITSLTNEGEINSFNKERNGVIINSILKSIPIISFSVTFYIKLHGKKLNKKIYQILTHITVFFNDVIKENNYFLVL
jgi:hypothetical protein